MRAFVGLPLLPLPLPCPSPSCPCPALPCPALTQVCGGDAFDLFQPEELELLVCGNPELDFHDLEAGTTYEDGYEAGSASVRRLWTVLHALAEPDKRLFLKFVSGSDRSPIDGLSRLGLVVSKNGSDDARLPSAHTCFNHLLLPDYSTIEVTRGMYLAVVSVPILPRSDPTLPWSPLLCVVDLSCLVVQVLRERVLFAIAQSEGFGLR